MIGTPCDVGTRDEGTLNVTYTPHTDGTDSVDIVCDQTNPIFTLSVANHTLSSAARGEITVTSSPGHIKCTIDSLGGQSGICADTFLGGTTVTLTSVPTLSTPLVSWAPGSCDSVSADGLTCTLTVNSVKAAVVQFGFS